MAPGRGTPRHAIRIPDDLWQAALAVARERDEDLNAVIRKALARYVKRHGKPND
jgi:predicted transcriptional regulator